MTIPYDNDNIFAKIIREELPCYKLMEDEKSFAFMDIMPRADGHCLVIPKAPSRNLLDIAPADLAHTMKTVQTIARAVKAAFNADGIRLIQSSEAAADQVVFHTHFHIIPCIYGVPLRPHTGDMADAEQLKKHCDLIKTALKSHKSLQKESTSHTKKRPCTHPNE